MAKASKKWTKKDYAEQAAEFVACYGKECVWDEFLDEYCRLFEGRLPFDPDTLMDAIQVARLSQEKA